MELPELLTNKEKRDLFARAETLWVDLQTDNLGGFSGINRPFYILSAFKEIIEDFGHRDVGLSWSRNDLERGYKIDNFGNPRPDTQD